MSSEGGIVENPEEISSVALLSPACTLLVSQRKIDFNLVCTLCSAPNQHEWKLFGANVWVGAPRQPNLALSEILSQFVLLAKFSPSPLNMLCCV